MNEKSNSIKSGCRRCADGGLRPVAGRRACRHEGRQSRVFAGRKQARVPAAGGGRVQDWRHRAEGWDGRVDRGRSGQRGLSRMDAIRRPHLHGRPRYRDGLRGMAREIEERLWAVALGKRPQAQADIRPLPRLYAGGFAGREEGLFRDDARCHLGKFGLQQGGVITHRGA